ncbi:MAG: ArsI/CadI family heavy metal resistance metalloenzyme [Ilumatobacter sp.]
MSRFQLSVNVDDAEAAVAFYTKLLGVGPAKHRPGYANFIVADPPMKLIVVENEGVPGTINHVGIEHETAEQVAAEMHRITGEGLPVELDDPHTCCYATQEKGWTQDPDGIPWEIYTVVADTNNFGASPHGGTPVDMMLPPVDINTVAAALDTGSAVVIDAQGTGDGRYEVAHIPGSIDFDLHTVLEQAAIEIPDKDQAVILSCTDSECQGSEFVGTLLVQAGYTNVSRFAGGVAEWRESGRSVDSVETNA